MHGLNLKKIAELVQEAKEEEVRENQMVPGKEVSEEEMAKEMEEIKIQVSEEKTEWLGILC
jgi:nicotinamide mononucleotide adenylyltransferase